MTTGFDRHSQGVQIASYLAIMLPRRNVRANRADTRFCILRAIGALRALRSVV
jgi:hypothetical protein